MARDVFDRAFLGDRLSLVAPLASAVAPDERRSPLVDRRVFESERSFSSIAAETGGAPRLPMRRIN